MRFTMPAATPAQTYLYGIAGHMHLVGTDEKITLDHAAGNSECLLQIPRWDFNWQRLYSYDAPIAELPIVGPNDKLTMRCTYDNTMTNPGLLQALSDQSLSAPRDVTLGETTLDEMCLGGFTFLFKSP
jgi:hypothetical protein